MTIPYILPVHVIPKSPRNQVIGWEKDAAGDRWLKVRVAAPPDEGQANKELIKFISKSLGLPQRSISLTSGEASRYKRLKIEGEIDLAALGLL
ncbi:MAG: DUF167 domain-containing protein [Alphaproteobacteria bacterium]|nr:DUF167 domain-containing protein [Alphaproteobacteria bacterium]